MVNGQIDPDARLLRQMQAGDVAPGIWQDFLIRIRGWICVHYPSLSYDADDLAGEVAVCAFERLCTFRGDAFFFRWVYCIAHNVASKRLRKQGRVTVFSLEEMKEEPAADDEIARNDLYMAANAALQTLTDQERTVFLLRIKCDMDHKEIARSLGVTSNASRQAWMRAARKMEAYQRNNPW